MGDLDLYSELIEEDDRKESAPKPPESLLEYMYLLESKCAELETEVETLNAHLARCEHERFQLITVNEQLQDNFARMGLACRREMVKLKCRVQWLCARANVRAAKYIDEPQNSQIPLTKLNPENALSYSDIISFLHSLKVPEGGLQPQTPMKSLQSNSNASFHPNGTVPVSVSQHSDAQPGTGPTFSHTSRRISAGSTVDSHSSPSRSSSSSSSTSSSSSSSSETAGSRNARTVTAPPSPSQVHRGIKCSSKSRSHIDPGRVKHPDSRPHNSINCKQRCRTEDDKRKQQPSSSSHSPRRRRSPSPSKSSRTTSWFDRSRKTHSNRSPSKTRSTWSTRQTASSSIGNDRIQVRQSNGFVRYGHDRSPQNTNSYKLTRDKSKSATQSSIVKVHTDAKPPTVTKRKASKTPRQSEEHPIWSSTESRQATPLDLSHNELHANKFVEAEQPFLRQPAIDDAVNVENRKEPADDVTESSKSTVYTKRLQTRLEDSSSLAPTPLSFVPFSTVSKSPEAEQSLTVVPSISMADCGLSIASATDGVDVAVTSSYEPFTARLYSEPFDTITMHTFDQQPSSPKISDFPSSQLRTSSNNQTTTDVIRTLNSLHQPSTPNSPAPEGPTAVAAELTLLSAEPDQTWSSCDEQDGRLRSVSPGIPEQPLPQDASNIVEPEERDLKEEGEIGDDLEEGEEVEEDSVNRNKRSKPSRSPLSSSSSFSKRRLAHRTSTYASAAKYSSQNSIHSFNSRKRTHSPEGTKGIRRSDVARGHDTTNRTVNTLQLNHPDRRRTPSSVQFRSSGEASQPTYPRSRQTSVKQPRMSKTSSVGSSYRPHILNRSPIPYSDRSRSASYSEHSLPVQHNLGERTLDSKRNMDFGKFRRNSGQFKRALPHNSPPRRVNSHHARLPFKSRFDRDRDFRRRRVTSPAGSNYRHSTTHNYRPVPKVDRIQRGRF